MDRKTLALFLLSALVALPASWAEPPCEPGLSPVSNLKLRYQPRENRCEGMYQTRVSSRPSLELVSLTQNDIEFPWKPETVLEVSAASSGPVRLRAVALPRATYYRMDARLTSTSPLVWPVREVLIPAGIRPSQLGVFAWREGIEPLTYVPVSIRPQTREAGTDQTLTALFRSTLAVQSAQWRIVPVQAGRCGGETGPWQEVQKISFDQRVLRVLLPGPLPDELCLEVIARQRAPVAAAPPKAGESMPPPPPAFIQTVRIRRLP